MYLLVIGPVNAPNSNPPSWLGDGGQQSLIRGGSAPRFKRLPFLYSIVRKQVHLFIGFLNCPMFTNESTKKEIVLLVSLVLKKIK